MEIAESVQAFTSGLSDDLKTKWFVGAFAIPKLPWSSIVKQRSSYLACIPPAMDLVDAPLPLLPLYKRLVEPDLSSEIITSEKLWQVLWNWLPEWVTTEQPECVFKASRDGYKWASCNAVIVYLASCYHLSSSLRTLFRKCDALQSTVLVIKSTDGEVSIFHDVRRLSY